MSYSATNEWQSSYATLVFLFTNPYTNTSGSATIASYSERLRKEFCMKRLLLLAVLLGCLCLAACTAAPKLLDEAYLQDTSLLNDTPCAAPCWRGIIPGQTSWRDMRTIIEDDGQFGAIDDIKDDSSEVRLASFARKDSPTPCCRIYSSLDGKTVGQILILLAPGQITLGDVIAKYGDPTYAAGADVTSDQTLVSLFYPDLPIAVYAFAPGIKEGELTAASQVIGVLYITQADMEEIANSSSGLYSWQGYRKLAGWLDAAPDITPEIQAEATVDATPDATANP
jgi:hypothetical protein